MKLILTGFHAIEETIKQMGFDGAKLGGSCLFYSEPTGPRVKNILALASQKKLETKKATAKDLSALVQNLPESLQNHRGLVLTTTEGAEALTLETFLASKKTEPFLTVALLSQIIDPHNVGAILRSADQFALDALILGEHKSAGDYATIAKISSGASRFVPIIRVKNLNRATETLKAENFWIYGADLDGTHLQTVNFAERTCIVLGSEGAGIAQSLKEKLDMRITIPTSGHIDSLNVSNAAAIIFYERYKRRLQN